MAGRKPKPTALKKLEGNPGKRKLTKAYFLFCVDVSLNLRIYVRQQTTTLLTNTPLTDERRIHRNTKYRLTKNKNIILNILQR